MDDGGVPDLYALGKIDMQAQNLFVVLIVRELLHVSMDL
jgi:hypothetical protein